MNFSKVLCLVALLVVGLVVAEYTVDQQFQLFTQKFGKKYSSHAEYLERLENFQASLERVAEKNAQVKARGMGATYGITKFADMSPEEFKSKILMKDGITKEEEMKHLSRVGVLKPKLSQAELPKTFDWRNKNAVTPVKNQGQCGSCWAFSATENIESMWILSGKSSNRTVILAPQQIVDCDDSDGGCNGGDTPTAFEYVITAGGMDSEASYPYTAEDGDCHFNEKEVLATISSWQYATSWYSESTLQQNLVSWGPLSICLDASNWQDYTGGVMTWEECAYFNLLDHCVQLVGYDQTDDPYWIVRNSWGTDWGVAGYIYLEMGEDTCGLAHEATCSFVGNATITSF